MSTALVPEASRASYPLRSGNAVRPLIDGEAAFRRICEAVEAARTSVFVTVAFIERDVAMPDARGTLFDVLDRAAARGLDVRVLFWREPRFAEFEPGDVTLSIYNPSAMGMEHQSNGNPYALHVDDVAAARAELESKGVEFTGDILDTGVCHMAFFADPDGNPLMLHHRYAARVTEQD